MKRLPIPYALALLLFMTVWLPGCGGEDPNDPDDPNYDPNRPPGTLLVLFLFSDSCDINDRTMAYLWDNYPVAGGKIIDSQRVVDRKLRYYFPPESGPWAIYVKNDTVELFNTAVFTKDKDVEFPEIVCQ